MMPIKLSIMSHPIFSTETTVIIYPIDAAPLLGTLWTVIPVSCWHLS